MRPDGLLWVEVQAPIVDDSGWRLMVPLVDLHDAADAPPFVLTVDGRRARVHLLSSAHVDDLGSYHDELDPFETLRLQEAARALLAGL